MNLTRGSKLGPYEILAHIGAGGMGELYRARDPQLLRDVAIKVLPEDVSADEERLARFENEARLASSLNHPNIVTIHSLGWESKRRYIVMEFIDGPTLQDLIAPGPMPARQALHIFAQIADGLAKAHEAGIIHRDLKPKNVMLTKDGIAKILDFGLSKLTVAFVDSEAPTTSFLEPVDSITKPGTILGTVEYMSPEQAAGRPLDFRSDQFSMGSLMYAILTGRKPFHRDSAVQTLSYIIEGEPRPIRQINPNVPQALEAVIQRCLMKAPQDRYETTRELVRDLREIESGSRMIPRLWTRRDWMRATAAVGVPLAAGAGLWVWTRRPYQPEPAALNWYRKGLAELHSMTFEAARKAFEQAVAADPKFALAHAGLATAYDLLDYSERAKESMLRAMAAAQDKRLSGAEQLRLRALQCVVSRDYDGAAPLFRRMEDSADDREKPAAALESGWLAEKREETEVAAAAYERALKMDPGYAAAKLRMGFIRQRRGEDELALKSFTEAANLYDAASDLEGVTETLYQQANLLNRRSRPAEAMPSIEKALAVAHAVGNRYQEIRLQLLQSAAARNLGQQMRARQLAEHAIEAAMTENMDNLAASGRITLGNALRAGGDYEAAENNYRSALEIAQRGKVRRYQALASISLGSLFEQKNQPEEAKGYIEAAVSFYTHAGYRRESVQSKAVLGGLLRQLGEFDEGVKVLRQALPNAVQLRDVGVERQLRDRLAEILQDQGAWPEALQESEKSASLPGSGSGSAFARLNCAGLYWRLGRRQDADRSLSAVEQLLHKNEDLQALSLLRLRQAEIAYGESRFEQAAANARIAISAVPAANDQSELEAKLIEALASIRTGRRSEGIQSAQQQIQEFEKSKMINNAASARLAIAEALAATHERGLARNLALDALTFFEPRRIWESLWRGHMAAARASNDSAEVEAHKTSARSAMGQLRKMWPEKTVESYMQRTDIRQLSSGM